MKRSKAYAVFFTLLFFGSLTQTMYIIFSGRNTALLLLAGLFNLILLFLAVHYWSKTFRKEN